MLIYNPTIIKTLENIELNQEKYIFKTQANSRGVVFSYLTLDKFWQGRPPEQDIDPKLAC